MPMIRPLPFLFCQAVQPVTQANMQTKCRLQARAVSEYRTTLKGKNVGVGREGDTFLRKASYVPSAFYQILYIAEFL